MTKKAESYSNGTVQSPSWDGISSVDSQFGAIIDTAWRNRHGPNQWANTTLDFIHDLLITHDTFTREQLEKELTDTFLSKMSVGPNFSRFLVKYLRHALAINLISVTIFCRQLFDRIQSDSSILETVSIFHDYVSLIELIVPQLTSNELMRQVMSDYILDNSSNTLDTRPVVIPFNPSSTDSRTRRRSSVMKSDEHLITADGILSPEKKGVKRKRENASHDSETTNGSVVDGDKNRRTKKSKYHKEQPTHNYDDQLLILTDTTNICVFILIKFLFHSVNNLNNETTDKPNIQKEDDDALSNLFNNFSKEFVVLSMIQSAKLLSQLFSNQRTQLLISTSRVIDTTLWQSIRVMFQDDFLKIFDSTIFAKNISENSIFKQNTITESLEQLWKSTLQLFSFISRCDDTCYYQPQDFHYQPYLNLKSYAHNALSLVIYEEIYTNDLTRTRLDQSFEILDRIRQLKQINLTNFFVELTVTTLQIIHSVPAKSEVTAIDFVDQHNLGTLNLYKSFFLSKLPLLFKAFTDKYEKDKEFLGAYIHRTSANLDDTTLNPVEMSLKLMKKFPTLYILSITESSENLLVELVGSCLDLKLVREENLKLILPDGASIPQAAQDPETLIEKFIESADINYLSDGVLMFRIHSGIVEKMVLKVSDPLHRDLFLQFICLNPSLLDVIHIHGKTLELIERSFGAFKAIFETHYESLEQTPVDKLHEQFSSVFSVLFLIVQRFQIITTKTSRKLFLDLMSQSLQSNNEAAQNALSKVSNWIYGWFHDLDMLPVVDPNSKGKEPSPCPIGDELIAALLELQTQQPPLLESQTSPQTTINFDKLQDIKTRYSPSQILEVTPYIVEQCQYAYSEKGMNALVSTQMLGFFVNFFGKYCDISVAVSLKNSLHRVFNKADAPENTNGVLLVTQLYSGNLWSAQQYGYNMGSSIIHNILQANIHFVNRNIQDTDIDPIIRNYAGDSIGPFLQKLLQDEYTTTRKILKYQVSHTTPPIAMPDAPVTDLIQCNILLPNTNHKLGNEMHELLTSGPEACAILRAFERAISNLIIHKRSPSTISTIIGSNSHANIPTSESFEILQTVLRLGGIRQFIHMIVNKISSFIYKEEESLADAIHVAEVGALVLGIIGGSGAIEYLLNSFLPIFLHNWMQLNKSALQTKPHSTTMQRIMKLHHYHHTAQVFAYFTVLAGLFSRKDDSHVLENFLAKQATALLSVHSKMPSASLPTLYFVIQALEICSLIPSLSYSFSVENTLKFAQLGSRFNSLDCIHSQSAPEDSNQHNTPPTWVMHLFDQKDVDSRSRCLLFYANRVHSE